MLLYWSVATVFATPKGVSETFLLRMFFFKVRHLLSRWGMQVDLGNWLASPNQDSGLFCMTRLWNDPFRVEVRGAKYIINRNGTGSQTPPTPLNRLQTNSQKAQCSTKVPPTGVQLIEFKFVGLVQTPFEAHHEEVELGLEKWCPGWCWEDGFLWLASRPTST